MKKAMFLLGVLAVAALLFSAESRVNFSSDTTTSSKNGTTYIKYVFHKADPASKDEPVLKDRSAQVQTQRRALEALTAIQNRNKQDGSSSSTGPSRERDRKDPKPDAHAALALEAVQKSLASREKSFEEYQLELSGGTTVRPDGSGTHQGSAMWQKLPEAFVLVNLFRGELLQEQALVVFAGNTPNVLFSHREKSPFSEGTIDRVELKRIATEIDGFFTVATDISRGPERFYPYLHDDLLLQLKHPDEGFRLFLPMRAVNPSQSDQEGLKEKLSDSELRRFVALRLDAAVQDYLLSVEGFMEELKIMESRTRLQKLRSNPREYIKALEENASESRRLYEKAGILTSEHLGAINDYVKRMLGNGFVLKEVPGSDACPCFDLFSAEKEMYMVLFGNARMMEGMTLLHFVRNGGRLQVVCIGIV